MHKTTPRSHQLCGVTPILVVFCISEEWLGLRLAAAGAAVQPGVDHSFRRRDEDGTEKVWTPSRWRTCAFVSNLQLHSLPFEAYFALRSLCKL